MAMNVCHVLKTTAEQYFVNVLNGHKNKATLVNLNQNEFQFEFLSTEKKERFSNDL